MEKFIKWFSCNHVTANFLMLAVLLAGFASWFQLRKEVFPEIAFDGVVVSVPYPNATPEEVISGVVIPIEEAISDVDGIKRVRSTASRNIGAITVEVETGFDTRDVMGDVQTRVDGIDNFAEKVEEPIFEEIIVNRQIISLAITADTDEASLRVFAEKIRDGLLNYEPPIPKTKEEKVQAFFNDPGRVIQRFLKGQQTIKKVELASVRPYEISIEVPEGTLRKYNLTLQQVAAAVRSASLDLPSGSVKTGSGEVVVRAVGRKYRGEEFQDIVVKSLPDGSELKLSQIAEVIDGFEDMDLVSTFNGRKAVVLHIFRIADQDTLAIARLAKEYVETVERPEGVEIDVWNDASVILKGRLDLLKSNIGIGLILVLLVLALFLRPSLAFLVALGIPVSFAGGTLADAGSRDFYEPDFGICLYSCSGNCGG